MKSFLILSYSIMTLFCFGQNNNYSFNSIYRKYAEQVYVTIDTLNFTHPSATGNEAAAIAAILPSIVEQTVKITKDILSANAKKFQAQYEGSVSENGFWYNKEEISLPKLTIHRRIINKDETLHANTIVLKPELAPDGSAFRFMVDSVGFNISKAKSSKKHPFCDLKLELKFIGIELSEKKFEKSEKGSTNIMIPAVSLGKKYDAKKITSGWLPILTNSGATNRNGNYEFEIIVTETNTTKSRKEHFVEFVEKQGETLASVVKIIVGSESENSEGNSDENTSQSNEQ